MRDERLTKIIDSNPDLCDTGFFHEYDDINSFEITRERLYDRGKAFGACISWLISCTYYKNLDTTERPFEVFHKKSSYELKRLIENKTNLLISNGVFIAAVLFLEIPFIKSSENPNKIFLPINPKKSSHLLDGKMTY